MLKLLPLLLLVMSCSLQAQKSGNDIFPGGGKPGKNEGVAVFGQGCFWHAEITFQSLEGVRDAVSGYAGGSDPQPTYEKVCTGATGHAECVKVYYDSTRVTFKELVTAFFASHDPTTLNRQGNDVGTEYRSIVFYKNEEQKKIIQEVTAQAQKKLSRKIVTDIQPLSSFYPAEAYHQEYILNHPNNRYIQNVSIPEYEKFRKEFRGRFKD